MTVKQLLRRKAPDVITITPDATVGAASRLLLAHRIGGLPVVPPEGGIAGFLSERDVVKAVHDHPDGIRSLPVRRVMRTPAPVCAADDNLHRTMGRMTRDRLRHLVVMEGDEILGVISVGDLVKHRLEQLETETGVLRDYVAAQRASR
jgi:CBS domain-containing protein